MKERPILFSGPMVRAILEGRKTLTRRMVKPSHVISSARTLRHDLEIAGLDMNGNGPDTRGLST